MVFSASEELQKDIEITRNLNGVFVGLLSEEETKAFNRLVDRGLAKRTYKGASGIMGLATVSIDEDV